MVVFDEEFFKKLREKFRELIDALKMSSPLAALIVIIVIAAIILQQIILSIFSFKIL